MRINLAGRVSVEDGERVLDESALPGRQGRIVLAYLALADEPVHRDVLADALWPRGLPQTWERTLSGVISRLRSALATAGFEDVTIANAFGCYELQCPQGARLDIDLSDDELRAAERSLAAGDPAAARISAIAAADIARRPLMADQEGSWLDAKRSELRTVLVRALGIEAEASLGTTDAIAAAEEAIEVDPFNEGSHVLLMRANAARGDSARALLAYERCRERLATELGVDPAPATQELYLELLRSDEDASRATANEQRARERDGRATGAIRRKLASVRTSFVGRQSEIAEVTKLLDGARLVTLIGAGGIGKTRLSIQLAVELEESFRHGAFFCDLSQLRDPGDVPRTVGAATGVLDPLAELESVEQHVCSALEEAELLVVLDNCEHVLGASARFCELLLDACPGVHVIATSRERLGVHGEHRYLVPPLTRPSSDDIEAVLFSEAARLFDERARAIRSDFTLGPRNAEAVAQICIRLDGIPLALELAAARLNALSPADIAGRLDDAFGVLTSGAAASPERHQTLAAAITWSHELLDERAAVLLRRLAVFVGGFSLEGAERVCGGEPLGPRAVLPLIGDLIDKSLVVSDIHGTATRYRLLEPVRQFAETKLTESGEAEEIRRAHGDYFLSSSRGVTSGLQVDHERLSIVVPELDNFRAALRWSVERAEAGRAMELAIAANGVWRYLGRPEEAMRWLESALSVADDRPSLPRAACLGFLGEVYLHNGNVAASHSAYLKALAIFRQRGLDAGIAWTLLGLSDTLHSRGEVDEMFVACHEATELFRRLDDADGLAWAFANDAGLSFACADLARSRSRAEECVRLGDAGPPETVTRMKGLLGVLSALDGDVEAGRERYEVALRGLAGGSPFELNWLSMMVGAFEVGRSSLRASAKQRLRVAIEMARAGATVRTVPWILELAAHATTCDGRYVDAARLFGSAEAHLERFGDKAPWEPFRSDIRAARVACAEALGNRFALEYAEGATLLIPHAVDLCLDVLR